MRTQKKEPNFSAHTEVHDTRQSLTLTYKAQHLEGKRNGAPIVSLTDTRKFMNEIKKHINCISYIYISYSRDILHVVLLHCVHWIETGVLLGYARNKRYWHYLIIFHPQTPIEENIITFSNHLKMNKRCFVILSALENIIIPISTESVVVRYNGWRLDGHAGDSQSFGKRTVFHWYQTKVVATNVRVFGSVDDNRVRVVWCEFFSS